MKLLFSSLIASLSAAAVNGQTLAEKWQIGEPAYTWTPADNKIDLNYAVSTFVTADNPSVEIFDASCGVGANAKTNGFTSALTGLEGTVIDISSETFLADGRTSLLDVTIDPQTLAADPDLFTDNGDNTASIVFCVRYSLDATGGLEVNFLENLITMSIDLSAGFDVAAFDVAPKDKIESTALQTYNVDAKLCVGTGDDVKADPPAETVYNQGSLITVCVYPDADAAADGIVMNNIDSYAWRRQDPEVGGVTPPEIYQNAIGSGNADANGLTTFADCNGSDVCVFDSILFAQFYATQGAVSGDGIATLQFQTARRLGANGYGKQRKLQQAESAADFGLNVDVNALDDGPGALATAGGATLGMTALISFMGLVSALLL
jgi:hypothetical protein